MLRTLERWGLVPADSAGVAEAEGLLASQRDRFRPESPTAQNPAKELARALCGRLPFIFGSNAAMGVVATRWRTQLNENSKVLAASQVFPELNHNEIVGWEMAGGTVAHPVVVLLRSRADSARLQQRVEFTKKLLALRAPVHEVWGEGESPLAQTLTAMYLGDVTSVYLALLQETDPTTITPIIELKRFLAEQPDTA
jgi:glucose/mannose-6-phosphate isomerase